MRIKSGNLDVKEEREFRIGYDGENVYEVDQETSMIRLDDYISEISDKIPCSYEVASNDDINGIKEMVEDYIMGRMPGRIYYTDDGDYSFQGDEIREKLMERYRCKLNDEIEKID